MWAGFAVSPSRFSLPPRGHVFLRDVQSKVVVGDVDSVALVAFGEDVDEADQSVGWGKVFFVDAALPVVAELGLTDAELEGCEAVVPVPDEGVGFDLAAARAGQVDLSGVFAEQNFALQVH